MTTKIFGATWCANCKTAKQFLEANGYIVSEQRETSAPYEANPKYVRYVNIDEFPDEAQANNIRSLPTLITEAGDRVIGSAKIKEYVTSQSN
jgi:glutaredoxin